MNDTPTGVVFEYIEVQIITPNFSPELESNEQKSPKDQIQTKDRARMLNLSQLDRRSFTTEPEVPIEAKTRDERIFEIVCGLLGESTGTANKLGFAIRVAPYLLAMANPFQVSRDL